MDIMEGDLIRTIRDNIQWIGHFHTGGNPGRHELDDSQETNYRAVAQAIADLNYQGFFSHEFVPVATLSPRSRTQSRSAPSSLSTRRTLLTSALRFTLARPGGSTQRSLKQSASRAVSRR